MQDEDLREGALKSSVLGLKMGRIVAKHPVGNIRDVFGLA